jgi:hypothetical protein
MVAVSQEYPWFDVANGDDLEQGDILEDCPIFLPPDDIVVTEASRAPISNGKKGT